MKVAVTTTAADPFAIRRVLIVADAVERVLADERFVTLVRAGVGRGRSLTIALPYPEPASPAGPRLADAIDTITGQARSAHRWEVRVVTGAVGDALLDAHEALVPAGPDDRALIIRAWQRGLCVVNALAQAAEAATFEDDDVDEPSAPGTRRWYSIMEGQPVIVTNPQHIVLGYGARINPRAVIHNESTIDIGRGSLLGADAELNLFTAKFRMGRFCHTSSYFGAVGSRHTLHRPTTFAVSRGPFAFLGTPADVVGDIEIGNDVWFGMRIVVLPGVHIADGCVIGAGSVVTGSLTEPYGIYAGNPARLLRFRFPPHVVTWLGGIQWWNWPTKRLRASRRFFIADLSDKTEDELWALIA